MPNVVEIVVTGKNLAGPAFASAEAQARGLQGSLTRMSGIVGAAFAVVAVEATKMATKFDAEMTRINTQAGVSKDKIKGLSDGVLDLAGKVGENPDSLAESLFHVESAFESTGITSKKALDLVKTAAEGARVGGANLVDVTNALTAAVASNIPGVKNMSQAMGVLNATVGVGDMKMQDLADAFGTGMVAVVKGYGLSIKDVGAALAVFGDNNIRGAQAGTQLRMAVQALARPAAQGKDALNSLGLGMSSLAHDMQQGGLNRAITDLKAHMDAAGISAKQQGQIITEAFGKKAGTGINILVSQFDRLESKYPALTAGADGFGAAWKATSETTAQKVADLKSGFEALMIKIGQGLLPIAQKLTTALGDMVNFFERNSAILTPLIAIVGSAAIAFWTLSKAIAAIKGIRAIGTDIGGLITKLRGLSPAVLAAGAGLGILAAAAIAFTVAWNKVKVQTHSLNEWSTALDKLATTGKATGPILDSMGKDFTRLSSSMKSSDLSSLSQIGKGFQEAGKDLGTFGGIAQAIQNPIVSLGSAIFGMHQKTEQAKTDWKGMDGALADLASNGNADMAATAFQKIADAAQKQGVSIEDLHKKFPQYSDALSGLALKNELAAETMGEFGLQAQTTQAKLQQQAQAAEGLKQAIEDLNAVNRSALDAMSAFQQAVDDASKAAMNHANQLNFEGNQINLGAQSARDAFQPLSDLAAKTDAAADAALKSGETQDQANAIYAEGRYNLIRLAEKMGASATQAKHLADQILTIPKSHNTNITANTSQASRKVAAIKQQIRDLNGKTIYITLQEAGAVVTAAGLHVSGGTITRATGGLVSTAATGGNRRGTVLVGEHGPELINLPGGGHVRSNPDSRRIMGQHQCGGGEVTIYWEKSGDPLIDALFDIMRKQVRTKYGQSTQRAFVTG